MAPAPSMATALEGLVEDPVDVRPRPQGPPPFSPEPPDDDGDGDRHGDVDDQHGALLRNAWLGLLVACNGRADVGEVVWWLGVWKRATRKRYTATRRTGVVLCSMYWSYVVGLWPVLYWLVYLY